MRDYFKLYDVILKFVFSLKTTTYCLGEKKKKELFVNSEVNFEIFKAVTWFLRLLTRTQNMYMKRKLFPATIMSDLIAYFSASC